MGAWGWCRDLSKYQCHVKASLRHAIKCFYKESGTTKVTII